jgi:hypothetical protein
MNGTSLVVLKADNPLSSAAGALYPPPLFSAAQRLREIILPIGYLPSIALPLPKRTGGINPVIFRVYSFRLIPIELCIQICDYCSIYKRGNIRFRKNLKKIILWKNT